MAGKKRITDQIWLFVTYSMAYLHTQTPDRELIGRNGRKSNGKTHCTVLRAVKWDHFD